MKFFSKIAEMINRIASCTVVVEAESEAKEEKTPDRDTSDHIVASTYDEYHSHTHQYCDCRPYNSGMHMNHPI